MAARRGVEHDAAAERVGRRERADHQAVACARDERLLEPQLRVAAAELGEPRRDLARAVVDRDAGAALRPRLGRGPVQRGVEPVGRRRARSAPGASPTTTSPRATSSTATPARLSATRWPACARSVGASWTCTPRTRARAAGREQLDGVAAARAARPQRPGHHGAGAADRERAVDVQHERAAGARAPRQPLRRARQRRRQRVEPVAGARRHRDRLGPRQQLRRLRQRARRVGEVGLGDRDDARRHRRAPPAPRRARASAASRRRRRRPSSGTGRSRSRRRPSCARSARGPARRPPTAAARPAASAARSRARSRSRARAPRAAGRCRRR